ncbi:hypothetical protein TrLO_g13281 [Triparma laevis f. longispina]|uniref:Uncharacterized protein n=1 Tax=Triparma laevis f. longispina TaxID=1714387 RepID=A0A9W7AU73_9STRA|nr:hypothetical protein TrLO_g13281 [Triparma laevis f. longispina]
MAATTSSPCSLASMIFSITSSFSLALMTSYCASARASLRTSMLRAEGFEELEQTREEVEICSDRGIVGEKSLFQDSSATEEPHIAQDHTKEPQSEPNINRNGHRGQY